ncbi:MAG: tetratricopeptide repeat protein, partial [Flavobacteriales bacterium]|nr:tetratricopeptide repeat protein [Flavobacteriales bacterium]
MKLSVFLSFVSCVSFTFLFAHHNIPTKQDFYSKTIEETDSILGHSLRQINSKNPEELGKSLASFLSICDSIQCLKNKKVVLRYRAKALSKQGELEALYGGLQEAKTIFIEAFQISQQLNDSSLISQNSIDLGYTLLYQGQRDSAIHYFNQAFTIDSLMQDSVGLISYWTNISSVYRDDGNIKKVLELSFKAMDYALALNEEQLLGVIYNTLGVCYIDQNNPHKAL